jgi:cytidyltransferase-like protein
MAPIWHDVLALAERLENDRRYTPPPFRVVVASGGFSPLHRGHARYIQSSARLGECLVVVVNGDGFLLRKHGRVFMPAEDRAEVVAALAGVDHVLVWDDGTQFVDGALAVLRPDVFAKGGDRSSPEAMAPCELAVCGKVGCTVAYGVGGFDKPQSSSRLVSNLTKTEQG